MQNAMFPPVMQVFKSTSTSTPLNTDFSKVVHTKTEQISSTFECVDADIKRIQLLFSEIEKGHAYVSPYDTAWVAMVPSLENSQLPQFPQCLSWIMDNQLSNGSWGLSNFPYNKDHLSHTLACIIALKRWNLGIKNVNMGLKFIKENIGQITNEDCYNPTGFDLIFAAMLEDARDLSLDLPYDSPPIELMLTKREQILKSIGIDHLNEYKPSMVFIIEGIRNIVDWDKVLRHESTDGSLFHSPSATACALMHTKKSNCLMYLNSMLGNLESGVPSVYPIKLITGLSMVDMLERLGIARHFKCETKQVLDNVYRCWKENEIIQGISSTSDIINSSISFRVLRSNGYDVSPDLFLNYLKNGVFLQSLENSGQAVIAMLNLYKASQLMFQGERVLEEAKSLSQNYLENIKMDEQNTVLCEEVKYALAVPWKASLERIEHLRYIKNFGFDDIRIGKTSYRIPCLGNDCFLSLAKNDYNICLAVQKEDLQELEKWSVDSKLGSLHFARNTVVDSYFSAASTLFSPEMSTARIVWTKIAALTVLMDDFYDVASSDSIEELQYFVDAVKRWDPTVICNHSDNVKILFSAIYNTVNDIAQDAWVFQGRDVSTHLREMWYKLAISMMEEAEWVKHGYIPTLEEYIETGKITIGLEPIVFTALYFVEPEISELTINHHEYNSLMDLVSICGRLLNDIQTYERETKQGKINSVSLFMKEYPGTSVENATEWMRQTVNESTQKLLRNLLQPSVLPRESKQLYWNLAKIVHLYYLNSDEITSPTAMLKHIRAIIFDPVS
ncbi:copalyl diphosphate synthase 1 isoform X2 [Cryptomeria japonica]|uniref:copalyl diphosphate synthase 1 isoform X2 n=1 Tax=Cryptomeria japonica TaxID=3369 RepID=UPI0027DA742D|nr:copalyl diphosphate synthase 1 isoform X2 [Cryptomeria japonica]